VSRHKPSLSPSRASLYEEQRSFRQCPTKAFSAFKPTRPTPRSVGRRWAAGTFPLRRIYFRNDRLVLPKVGLPARPINEHDGWCDDPRSTAYNRLVRIPNDWSHEKMWREDGLYDLVVVVGYNDDPPEGEWGSAIFLHIARDDNAPTRGCVAFARDDLLEIVTLIGPQTRLSVLSLPATESTSSAADDDPDMKQFEDFDEKDW
jgi:hypothetical protein